MMPRPFDPRQDRGTAANSGSADLAIVGAVPAVFAPPEAQAAERMPEAGQPAKPTSSAASSADARDKAPEEPAPRDAGGSDGTGSVVAQAPAAEAAAPPSGGAAPGEGGGGAAPSPPTSAGIATFVPAAVGAGSSNPITQPAEASGRDVEAGGAITDAVIRPSSTSETAGGDPASVETLRSTVAALQETVAWMADRLGASEALSAPGSRPTVTDPVGSLADSASDVTDLVASATATTLTSAGALVERVADAGDSLLAGAGDALLVGAGVLPETKSLVESVEAKSAGLLASASATVDAVTETAASVVAAAPLAATVDAAPAPFTLASDVAKAVDAAATPVLATATDAVGSVAGAVADIGTFTGADPIAGVKTLVAMVNASDAFDVTGVSSVAAPLAPALGALGAADLLAKDAPTAGLLGLGDKDDDGALLGVLGKGTGLLGGSDDDSLFG